MSTIQETIQSLTPGPYVELYSLDTGPLTNINGTPNGGQVFYWTPGPLGGADVVFNGVSYTPLPIQLNGLLTTGQGKPPTPSLSISLIGGIVLGIANFAGTDLLGAKITRMRTFERYLDGQPLADPTAFLGPDIFYIDQKTHQDRQMVQFALSIVYDQLGRQFPGRQVFRDACTRSYRFYDSSLNNGTGGFVYGSCPYAGSAYYNAQGQSVSTPQGDSCGKRLSDCQLRFPNQDLPTWAFPGVNYTAV